MKTLRNLLLRPVFNALDGVTLVTGLAVAMKYGVWGAFVVIGGLSLSLLIEWWTDGFWEKNDDA